LAILAWVKCDPFAVELRFLHTNLRQIFVADLNSGGIFACVQPGLDLQSGFGFGVANQVYDHLVTGQRFPTPVRRDMTEHTMFDLVPLAGAGRKMTDRQAKTGVVGQSLQGHLPQP